MSSDEHNHHAWPSPSHEMQEVSHDTLSASPPQGIERERRRVRINSSAAEIPGVPNSYSRVSDVEAQDQDSLQHIDESAAEANDLLHAHSHGDVVDHSEYPSAGTATQSQGNDDMDEYAYSGNTQGGVFYQLLQAYKQPTSVGNFSADSNSPPRMPESASRPGSSGGVTPRKKWYEQEKANKSQETLATLIGAAQQLANPKSESTLHNRYHKRNTSNPILSKIWKAKEERDAKIKIHVATILKRQQYIIKMCRALMLVGAPSHRLEEYLATTAKVLDINSQFLYIPGCMIVSFDDPRRSLYLIAKRIALLISTQLPILLK